MRIKLNLDNIVNNIPSSTLVFGFYTLTNQSNFSDSWQGVTQLSFTRTTSSVSCGVIQNGTTFTLNATTLHFLSATDDYVVFDCNLDTFAKNNIEKLLSLGYVELDVDGYTGIILYTQNSENDVLNKNLTLVNIIDGKFNHSIGVKNINIDVVNLSMNFNYVWIPSLNRYYYVDSLDIISADVTRLHLKEDVLMSWKNLILNQDAFITRSEIYNNKYDLIDDRLPTRDTISFTQYILTHLSEKNVTFDYLQYKYNEIDNKNILINTYTQNQYSALPVDVVESPVGSDLPDISPLKSKPSFSALIPLTSLGALVNACVKDDATASYVASVIWLPFKADDVFTNTQATTHIHAGKKVLDGVDGGKWVDYGNETNPVGSTWIHDGATPYLIVADFMFNSTGGVGDIYSGAGIEIYKPYSTWEIYIPFVNWVEVDINKVKNKRIQVIYTMDMETGLSTAYLYNRTDNIVLFSATCQIGIRLNMTTSNEIENTKQKQANDLNMVLGALSSVVSIGVGAYSGNAVAIAGGVLSASKTIASYVNSNNMLFDRANISFGSSSTALYSPNEVKVRRSYHFEIPKNDDVYEHLNGYPSNTYGKISLHTGGYIEVGEIHFDPQNNVIYQDEITEIVDLLKNGVIV